MLKVNLPGLVTVESIIAAYRIRLLVSHRADNKVFSSPLRKRT